MSNLFVMRSVIPSELERSIKRSRVKVQSQMFAFITPSGKEYYIEVPIIAMKNYEMRHVFNRISENVQRHEKMSKDAISELEGIIYESLGVKTVTQSSLYPLVIKK